MTKSLLLLSVAALMLPACRASEKPSNTAEAAEAAAVATIDAAADEKAIRGQVERWHELMKAKDAAGIAALYTDNGAVMPPNAPMAKGSAAVQPVWASLMAMPGFDLSIMPDEIVVAASGDMAMDRGAYRLTVAPNGTAQTDTGKYVVVWRKVDGEWKAAADIFNSDLPAASG